MANFTCHKINKIIHSHETHLFFLFLCCLDVFSSTTDENLHEVPLETNYAPIILEEERIRISEFQFISFWNKFRCAVIENDTVQLATMVIDTLRSDCFLSVPGQEDRITYPDYYVGGKISKFRLISLTERLFTPPFFSLLKNYDIEKDLKAKQTKRKLLKERPINFIDSLSTLYVNNLPFRERLYFSGVYQEDHFWIYRMGFQDTPSDLSYSAIYLYFRKEDSQIKLSKITCSFTEVEDIPDVIVER